MTREEMIRQLQSLREHCRSMIRDKYEDGIWVQDIEALDIALSALRPVSREQVRRGEWEKIGADYRGQGGIWRCTECRKTYPYKCDFCPNCGTPMTDEAVEMVMERLEKLKNEIG